VRQLARWGKGSITEVAYAPDGKLLAVATTIGIYIYDADSLAEVRYIETGFWVTSLAYSPDGTVLASGSNDGTIKLWQVRRIGASWAP
jgi:WD40 repeat protein